MLGRSSRFIRIGTETKRRGTRNCKGHAEVITQHSNSSHLESPLTQPDTGGTPTTRRLPGPAAGRRLGDRPVLPQRLGADTRRRVEHQSRPKIFTRSYRTGEEDFDREQGRLEGRARCVAGPEATGDERRKVYDTTQPGRGNGGHDFGDDLTDEQRWAVVDTSRRCEEGSPQRHIGHKEDNRRIVRYCFLVPFVSLW